MFVPDVGELDGLIGGSCLAGSEGKTPDYHPVEVEMHWVPESEWQSVESREDKEVIDRGFLTLRSDHGLTATLGPDIDVFDE